MSEWTKKKCTECGKNFFIKIDWSNHPVICNHCRATKVQNIVQKMENYLRNREKYDSRPMSLSDKIILQEDKILRIKIEKILSQKDFDHSHLISELLEDKEIRKLVLRIDKECKINDKSRKLHAQKNGKIAVAKIVSLVQGGAPGLGKKA